MTLSKCLVIVAVLLVGITGSAILAQNATNTTVANSTSTTIDTTTTLTAAPSTTTNTTTTVTTAATSSTAAATSSTTATPMATTSSTVAATNSTAAATSSTTPAATTATTGTTMMMPPPPPAPMPCDALSPSECGTNTSCYVYAGMCLPSCTYWSHQGSCAGWAHCWARPAPQTGCKTKCAAFGANSSSCWAAKGCIWYNSKCVLSCPEGNFDMATCTNAENSGHCRWSYYHNVCLAKCSIANGKDAFTCSYIINEEPSKGCDWDPATKMCIYSCAVYTAENCTSLGGSRCEWSGGKCRPACSSFTTAAGCALPENSNDCMWYANMPLAGGGTGACRRQCVRIMSSEGCASVNEACHNHTGSWNCATKRCDYYDETGCLQDSYHCQFDGGVCKIACTQYSFSTVQASFGYCPPSRCQNATGFCNPMPCANVSVNSAPTCAASWCMYQASAPTCLESCGRQYSEALCTSAPAKDYCEWGDNAWGSKSCLPKCDALTTYDACTTMTYSDCAWDASTSKCRTNCRAFNNNLTKCAEKNWCSVIGNAVRHICLPKCSTASTKMQCQNRYFGYDKTCVWSDSANACQTRCQYTSNTAGTCDAANNCYPAPGFGVLCQDGMPSTMPPSTTAMPTPTSTQGTTGAGGSTQAPPTATPTSTQGTTGAGGSTQAPPTAPPATTQAAGTTSQIGTTQAAGTTSQIGTTQGAGTTAMATPTSTQGTTGPGGSTQAPPTAMPTDAPTTMAPAPRCVGLCLAFSLTPAATAPGAPLGATGTTQSQADFIATLASLLNLPASSLAVDSSSSGDIVIKITDSNATAAEEALKKATTLDAAQLASLGAAGVSTVAPAPPAASGDDFPIIPVAAGGGGGLLLLIIIIVLATRKKDDEGTGENYTAARDYRGGKNDGAYFDQDQPMLQMPTA